MHLHYCQLKICGVILKSCRAYFTLNQGIVAFNYSAFGIAWLALR
jgi:hypothetical protein